MYDFTGPDNGQFDFEFDESNEDCYTEENRNWILSFDQGSKTRWLLSRFLMRHTVDVGKKKPVVVDKLIPTRQRCCILSLPAFYTSEKNRIDKARRAKEKELTKKLEKATEKETAKTTREALQARLRDPDDMAVFCCFLCKTIVDIETLEPQQRELYAFGGCRQQFKHRFFCHACHGGDESVGNFAFLRHAESCKLCTKKLNLAAADDSKVATDHEESGSESEDDE